MDKYKRRDALVRGSDSGFEHSCVGVSGDYKSGKTASQISCRLECLHLFLVHIRGSGAPFCRGGAGRYCGCG